jgi:nucleotide-binding universal stress UspA family protein
MTTVAPAPVKDVSIAIHKILVAVDLTENSDLTINYAAQLAKSLNASIVLVHVFEPHPMYEFPNEYAYDLIENQRREAENDLVDLMDKVRAAGVGCESAFLDGEPAERITALARQMDADLIVTASHHPTFLARLFNLDKAPQILHRAPCPVLIYHEREA